MEIKTVVYPTGEKRIVLPDHGYDGGHCARLAVTLDTRTLSNSPVFDIMDLAQVYEIAKR